MVLSTRKGSVPPYRDFGLSRDYTDLPLTGAMLYRVAGIGRQIEKYIPRIRVRDIVFDSGNPAGGILEPTVAMEKPCELR